MEITTTPPGATLSVNGTEREGTTPMTVDDLPLGQESEITLHLGGHLLHTEKYVASEKSGALDIKLKQALVKFNITSKPDGSRITVDGKWNGNTPTSFMRKRWKPEFKYKVDHKGYESLTGTVTEKDWVEEGKFHLFTLDTPLTKKEK